MLRQLLGSVGGLALAWCVHDFIRPVAGIRRVVPGARCKLPCAYVYTCLRPRPGRHASGSHVERKWIGEVVCKGIASVQASEVLS